DRSAFAQQRGMSLRLDSRPRAGPGQAVDHASEIAPLRRGGGGASDSVSDSGLEGAKRRAARRWRRISDPGSRSAAA
ncbi:hypothetical protein K4A07_18205, partial [Lactiplantibacillus plantarum]|nr:hypothetical protein [Lactiplantibacillus plantarum]